MNIKIGDKVRSFDFADGDFGRDLTGERACYVEGFVVDITRMVPAEDGFLMDAGCDRYVIEIERQVFGGEEVDEPLDRVYPPVNGTPTWGDRVTNCVEVING